MNAPQIWVIGSATECDIVVARKTVSGRHCRLVKIGGQFYLDDLQSTNGTYVNGTNIRTRTPVSPNDQILLGSNVPMPWPETVVSGSNPSPGMQGRVAPNSPRTGSALPCSIAPPMMSQSDVGTSSDGPRVITIGRDASNDIVFPFPMVSAHHALLTVNGTQVMLDDLGSSNGTYINSRHNRITHSPLNLSDIVYFGSMRVPASRLVTSGVHIGSQMQTEFGFTGEEMVFGRDPTCQQVLDYPMISHRHARIFRNAGSLMVQDLGSANGTYVNGQRILIATPIKPGDTIGLGSYTFQLTDYGTLQKRDYRGNVTIEARGVVIEVSGKRLLDDISLTIYPSEFVGLMGPSGAGKTTFMNALNGYVRPTSGQVLFNGQDLYKCYGQFAHHLGYVPQDDIIHRDLTVGQALYFTAKLRLPPDTTESEIQSRIARVVKQLGLEGTEHVLIGSPERKGISGGQRKRVNLAMELLTDPSVLFLDEPTSGLSSEDALMVMKVLRSLADSGKAILLTIHQPSLEAYRLMDNLVLVGKDRNSPEPGQLVYYGPAYPDAVTFFNPHGVPGHKPGIDPPPDEVLRGFDKQPTAHWVKSYRASPYGSSFVVDRAGKTAPPLEGRHTFQEVPRVPGMRQWMTLVRRYITIKLKDTWNTAILLSQAPIVALLIVMVFGEDVSQEITDSTWASVAQRLPITVFLMGLSALWFGCSNAVREIVGEWAIYHRERMVNLRIPSYVLSKLTVLAALCLIQCGTLVLIVYQGCKLEGNMVVAFLLLSLVSIVGISLGLLLSSIAKTSEVAIALLPIMLLPMVILGGLMQPVHNMNGLMRSCAQVIPSRWGFESMLLNEIANRPLRPEMPQIAQSFEPDSGDDETEPPSNPDMAEEYFPEGERLALSSGAFVLGIMSMVLITSTQMVLRYRDVH